MEEFTLSAEETQELKLLHLRQPIEPLSARWHAPFCSTWRKYLFAMLTRLIQQQHLIPKNDL